MKKKENVEEKVEEQVEEVAEEQVIEAVEEKEEKKKPANSKKKKSKNESAMVNYEKEEVEKLISKLAQTMNNSSEIGRALRDKYGIPDVKAFGFTIGQALEKNGVKREIPEDLYNLIKKAVIMHNHLDKNKKDRKGIHRLQLIESRVRKLGRYYEGVNKLPKGWKYDITKAKLLVKG